VNKFIATLLVIPVCSLHIGLAYSADVPDATVRGAAISALNPAALPSALIPVLTLDFESREPGFGAAVPNTTIPYEDAASRKASIPTGRTLDLRLPDPRRVYVPHRQQASMLVDSDEEQAVSIVTAPLLPEERSDIHLSLSGIGSLFWAARHPAQAWRVLLPIEPGDGPDISADLRTMCAVLAEAPSGRGTPC
jgi:hypothetical protein